MTTVDYSSEEVRAALAEIAEQHHGVLNGRDIVEAARESEHVLHRFFEWDDPTASEAYRLVQASALIRRVRLSIVRSAEGTRELSILTTRQFQSRPSMRSKLGGYEPIEDLLSDEDKRTELLGQVLRESGQAWRSMGRSGAVRLRWARQGMAGKAERGRVWHGQAWQGSSGHGTTRLAGPGVARRGIAKPSGARRGEARRSIAGKASQG
jgi:hypothetical protein